MARRRYLHRLSGPLLDRVDLQVEVLPVTRAALATVGDAEGSAVVAARVAEARAVQRERWRDAPWAVNAHAPGHELRRRPWRLPASSTASLDRGVDRGTLTVRGYDRVLRTAWTLADLDGRSHPRADDVERAFSLRHQAAA
jgi:magnesium chelatase family protein